MLLESAMRRQQESVLSLSDNPQIEVYRARDTRLERTVAIKVLPPELGEKCLARTRDRQTKLGAPRGAREL